MKVPQKITRIKLSVNDQDKPIIYGLVTPDPDYKLSLKINVNLHISLKNTTPVISKDNLDNELSFSRFSDLSAAPDTTIYLISNRSGKNFLLKQLKNVDYIFLIYDAGISWDIEKTTASLRRIESITAVFNVDMKTLKDKNLKSLPI